VLHQQGDLAGARSLFVRVLAIREKVLGAEDLYTKMSLNNLAHFLKAQGDLAGARSLYERELAISEKEYGPENRDLVPILNNLAGILKAQNDLAGARLLYERAVAISGTGSRYRHEEDPWHAISHARLLLEVDRAADALTVAQTALMFHFDGPWTRDVALLAVEALELLGSTEEAEALREEYGLVKDEKPAAT
jgi:tetratricopeptide (TPR) repeat protein